MREQPDFIFRTEAPKESLSPDGPAAVRDGLEDVSLLARKEEGQALLKGQLENIGAGLKQFLPTIEGFRRDAVTMVEHSDSPLKIRLESVRRSYVPPAISEEQSLSALSQTLKRAVTVLEGDVHVPSEIRSAIARSSALLELGILHKNLSMVGSAAKNLHDLIQTAVRSFDQFNAKNGEEYAAANVAFDRDSANISSEEARAIVERAVRLDIDVVTATEQVRAMDERAGTAEQAFRPKTLLINLARRAGEGKTVPLPGQEDQRRAAEVMKKQVLVIHGGSVFDSYEAYFASLQAYAFTLDRLMGKKDWKASLASALQECEVFAPQMPCGNNARYAEWKVWFDKILPLVRDGVILVGHSLGGIFLAKYLAENVSPVTLGSVHIIAGPSRASADEPVGDFALPESLEMFQSQADQIYLYFSQDDPLVSFDQSADYVRLLPHATLRAFADRGHFKQESFPELVADIQR